MLPIDGISPAKRASAAAIALEGGTIFLSGGFDGELFLSVRKGGANIKCFQCLLFLSRGRYALPHVLRLRRREGGKGAARLPHSRFHCPLRFHFASITLPFTKPLPVAFSRLLALSLARPFARASGRVDSAHAARH